MAVSLVDRDIVARNAPTVPSTILMEDPLQAVAVLSYRVGLE